MTALSGPAILIHSRFLAARLEDWRPGDYPFCTPDDIAGGVTPHLAQSIEVLVSGGEPLDNALVDSLPRLRLVACFSTGYAGIDLAHLRERGIALTSAGGVNAHDVADHAVALLLAWWHGIVPSDRLVREGGWRDGTPARRSLRGKKAGVVGLGRIGRAIADRLAAHDIEVGYWGPREKPDSRYPRATSLVDLAEQSDILVVASRAVPENAKQIDAEVLRALGQGGVLINVSRGFLVDEQALIAALRDGTIAGAALDVFEDEPTDPALWHGLGNVVLTPHLAGYTLEAGQAMFGQLRENIRRYLSGEALLSPVEDVG